MIRFNQSNNHVESGGFTCTIRTQKPHNLALFDAYRYVIHHGTVTI